jgi:hypothetical protein
VALRRLDDVPLERRAILPEMGQPDGSYYLRLGTGFDSNPELVSDTIDRPTGNAGTGYADLFGNVEHPLGTSFLGTTLFRANLQARQHSSDTGFDEQDGELGLRQSWRAGAWRLGLTGEGGAAWLDGSAYQGTTSLGIDGRRAIAATMLTLRYEALRVAGEGVFDYLDGWRHLAETDIARSLGSLRARIEVEYELNDRADLFDGQEFSSYSPRRAAVGVSLATPPLRRLSFELRSRYRDSRYRDPNRFMAGGALQQELRQDRLAGAGLRTRWRRGEAWNWLLDYEYGRNASTIDSYAYTRHVLLFGIEWLH